MRGMEILSLPSPAATLGYLAAAFTILAYAQTRALPLRLFGLSANVAFLAYGFLMGAAPVALLHAALLAVNATRLRAALRARRRPEPAAPPRRAGVPFLPARAPVGPA
jgi:hypothetical protein